ncbi:uncharacterized protein LOC126899034 [Daktulosphaira vitifoliae]|uniref:uncharacterized protein LOC126899034 n=1 Tax=Daktulosphaira vitifoliae TaxID=58002 RepID=UPI0021AA74C1|nr:uncharacterized protein LOC126899034 [Daktulosphaira vitifoliae]
MLKCGTQEKLLPALNKKWKPIEKCDRTKILHLRRPSKISKLIDSVPLPKSRPIKDALPNWEIRELSQKIPQYHGPGPNGPINFHRGIIGHYPWKVATGKLNFSLDDPYGNEVSYSYNPLHDPHLKRWINIENNRKFLIKQGLITKDTEVICSLKEYNEYRRFLWRVHKDEINRKIKEEDEKKIEQKKISNAIKNHKKDIAKKMAQLKILITEKNLKEKDSFKFKKNEKKFGKKKKLNRWVKKPFKKIETYTVYGEKKGGIIDPSNYKGIFIKGSPEDFIVLDFYKYLFKEPTRDLQSKSNCVLNNS